MDQFFQKKNEVNYASKFKDESADAPRVIRASAPAQGAAPSRPYAQPNSAPDYYAFRAEMMNRESNSQLMVLQSELSRLREEINRQNQKSELRDEIARLRDELKKGDKTPRAPETADYSAEKEFSSLISELRRTAEETAKADLDVEQLSFTKEFSPEEKFAGASAVGYIGGEPVPRGNKQDNSDLLTRIDALKTELLDSLRAESGNVASEVYEKLSQIPREAVQSGDGSSIIDTSSIMQSTLLDELLYLKRILEDESVKKTDLGSSVDKILARFDTFASDLGVRSAEEAAEREIRLNMQFSLLYEMLAYNFETNSELIEGSRESLEEKFGALSNDLVRNSDAASELVIKLTKIISLLGVEVKNGKDVLTSVREGLDERFGSAERSIKIEIESLSERLKEERRFESAKDGVDLLSAMGGRLFELVGKEKAERILALKSAKDSLRDEIDVAGLARYIKDKAILLQDYGVLVRDVVALKEIVSKGLDSKAAKELRENILELPLDMLFDFTELASNYKVETAESMDSEELANRISSLQSELVSLRENHQTLYENVAQSVKEIAAAVDGGAKSEQLERVSAHMDELFPEQLAAIAGKVDSINSQIPDKNDLRVRLENISFELAKLTEFSEIQSVLYDFKKEVEDAIEGNISEFGGQVKDQVGTLASRVEKTLESNEIAVEVAKLAQNVAVSPNFDQTIVLEEIDKLRAEVAALRDAMSPSHTVKTSYAEDAAFAEIQK